MGVRINKIEIRGFRGIPFLELILDGKNLVIRGDNGTGKSSIVEAIEFFFTKRVAHLEKSKSLSTKRYAPHINFKPKDVKITITFNPGNIVLSKTFSSDPNPPGSLKEYFNEAQKGTFILRRSQIIEFIVSPPSERFRAIGSIIGIEPLDEIELQMMKVRDELEGVISSKKEEKKRILGELSKTLEKKIESIEDVLLILNKRLKNAKLPPISSLENTDKYYENLLRKMKETRDIDRISNLNEIVVLIKMPLTYEGIFDEITNFSEKVKKLLRKEAKIELSVANLLRDGKKILEEEELDKCPLCGQNINRDKLLKEINHRLETLQALTKEASEVRRQSSGIINQLNSILEKLKRVAEKLKVFPEFVDEQGNLAQKISFIEKLIEAVSNAKDLKEEIFIPVKEFAQEKSEIEKLWTSISKKCNKLLRKEKLTKKEKYMLEIISLIEGIKNKIGEVRRISSELEGYIKQYELAKKIYATFSEVKKKKIQEVYSTIQADICKFYESLHPNEPHRSIKITINPKRRASTELWIESFGREADPRAYASEGHLDSLGLCIFLAFVKKFNKKYGIDYVFLGYRPGVAAVMINMGRDIRSVFAVDYFGTPLDSLPMMQNIKNYSDIAILVGLEAGSTGDAWVQFAQARYNQKIILGGTAVVAPDLYPYLQAGQIVGLIGGMRGAADYEKLVNSVGPATIGMTAQTVIHIVILIFILLGNVGYFLTRRKQ